MKVLIIIAHADDAELSCGGTIARLCKEGNEVFVNLVTSSDYTNYNGQIIRDIYESEKESINGLQTLGIKDYKIKCLGYRTKEVLFNSGLIESINRSIDIIKPDLIITHHMYAESHQDHINTAKSVMSAARYCNTIWCFEPMYPSKLSSIPFHPMMYVDISNYLETKINSLRQHISQFKKYPYWQDLVTSLARVRGIEIKTQYAEAFEIIKETY